ncbi:shikimate kinase [Fructilactobacillus myrtifloralis]|uniref:Shikimate kinase n=1 Tax=Fructilactobacillus myrtifloralis TaxID=2940301 RepID=A0ABY5BN22_9LACO|nr:shikimate kinase [Fructilactobacillus myrtifloralis]USS84503.1 shikimate kinase [Fructilactobacillus myrtifloralis]
MDLILIGFMGSGKTTISRRLGQRLGLPVTDLDQVIVTTAEQSIATIFAEQGEAGFRRLETQALAQQISQPGILATGGGVPTQAQNRSLLHRQPAPVVLLEIAPETAYERVKADEQRPLAKQLDLAKLAALKVARQANYQRCADLIVDANQSPDLIVDEILTKYQLG